MSGGRFDYTNDRVAYEMGGQWRDPVINELFDDLFRSHNYGNRNGGLAQMLDFWLSGDIGEEDYREAVLKFKKKWFGTESIERDVIERYIDEKIEQIKAECLGEVVGIE